MTAAEVVHVQPAQLEQLDPAAREAAVTAYLSHARDQLALAVQMTGPEAVAAIKAEIATAAEATKQLGLSKEIQQDAQEMVRRAEYALGKAIRAGQERGEIRASGQRGASQIGYERVRNGRTESVQEANRDPDSFLASPQDFAAKSELAGARGHDGIYAMSDGVTEPEFEAALSDARAEENLSRANVVRKIQGVKNDGLTPVEKLVKIRELAPTGRTSGQIAKEIGASEDYVRRVAAQNGIEITADKVMRGSRRGIDSNRIVEETVIGLEGMVTGLRLINFDDLDLGQISHWSASLTESLRALNRLARQIKEMDQ